uniref:Acyl-CoA carboxylase alpha chain n=1 Tax=Aurantimonas manganoxydans TaxID=651183 RepID=A0A0P0Z6D9_9HYPH|nr:Acyl-CoA carboxylase alpha chain [Aurantimonas manganoxydans SI85-9A1]
MARARSIVAMGTLSTTAAGMRQVSLLQKKRQLERGEDPFQLPYCNQRRGKIWEGERAADI